MAPVEAVIVAGGFGTRLLPLTRHRPKHLLPLAGVPFLAHQLAKLATAGVERVVLATSYRAEQFAPVLGDGSAWGVDLHYVTEAEPLGTGGAIRNAAQALLCGPDEPVVVLNGDILGAHDLAAQVAAHRERQADVTLHLVEVADPSAFGCVPTDRTGLVTGFLEKTADPVSRQVNAGCYVFDRRVVDEIPSGRPVSVEREIFPGLVAAGRRLLGVLDDAYWLDVGTPEALVRGSRDVVRGDAVSPAYGHPPGEAWVAGSAAREGARVTGGSAVSEGARLGRGAVVDGSIVCAEATVGAGATVMASVVGPAACVGDGAVLDRAVIGDRAWVAGGCRLPAGTRVECDARAGTGAS